MRFTEKILKNTSSVAIIEAFKLEDINKINNNNLDIIGNYDKIIKFRQFY